MARDRWEEVIVDDDGDPIDIAPDVGARYIATELPDTVDDVYIAGSVILWDGPGGILGVAATTAINQDSNGKLHPKAGSMVFDEADVQDMINFGTWTNVILHEMGHVIGIGLFVAYIVLGQELDSDRIVARFQQSMQSTAGHLACARLTGTAFLDR